MIDLNRAINLNASNIKALQKLFELHISLGNILEANVYLRRLTEIEGKTEENIKRKEKTEYLLTKEKELRQVKIGKDYSKWQKVSEEIHEHCPFYETNTLILIESLLQNGQSKRAQALLKQQKLDESEKRVEFIYLKGLMYYFEGK